MSEGLGFVRQSRLADRPDFSGAVIRPDGVLAVYAEGRGLACGPWEPARLRAFAADVLAIANQIEAAGQRAAAEADRQLAAIVEGAAHE
jgi:hypothetical protein